MAFRPVATSLLASVRSGTGAGRSESSLFGLAPDGVYHASRLTPGAVVSYTTFSPLPRSF